MIQWITILIAMMGLVYNGYKDYTNGQIKLPLTQQKNSVQYKKPIMYWQVAFDPNTGKLYHLHQDGIWYDQPPQIREHSDQNQKALGVANGTQGTQGYHYGYQAQTPAYTQRY